jgi:hypothetical protein
MTVVNALNLKICVRVVTARCGKLNVLLQVSCLLFLGFHKEISCACFSSRNLTVCVKNIK